MKIVLLGDLGSNGGYHLGDEAMAEAVVEQLDARTDVEVIAVSGDPEDTSTRYKWRSVPRIGFGAPSATDAQRDARLEAVLAAARGDVNALAWSDDAWKVIHAVDDADAVVISGGGNLSSTWPEHLYERAALALLAAQFNKVHVVTGQTIGPHLTGRHGELVARVLTSAALVGVREAPSGELAARLGVLPNRLVRVVDDAARLRISSIEEGLFAEPYLAATISPDSGMLDEDSYIQSIAGLLDHVATTAGLRIVLIPHHGTDTDGVVSGDLLMHKKIAERVSSGVVENLASVDARYVAAITAGAALVISSRYHPIVFALGASVPALGISVDAYTSTKIHGAMANYGVGDYAIGVASFVEGGARSAVDDLLGRREEIADHLRAVQAVRAVESDLWWDGVTAVLLGADSTGKPADLSPVAAFAGGGWTKASFALRTWSDAVSLRLGADRLAGVQARAEAASLVEKVDSLEREIGSLEADIAESADEMDTLRASARAAHQLVSDQLRPLALLAAEAQSVQAARSELNAMYNTRTFRYLERPRRLYGKVYRKFRPSTWRA